MQKALHIRTKAQPGGKIKFASPELDVGQTVDVVVLHESNAKGRPVMEILNGGTERRLFQTAQDVKAYLAEEKASWNRQSFPRPGPGLRRCQWPYLQRQTGGAVPHAAGTDVAKEAQDGNLTIVSSPVLVVESLVKPLRDGNTEVEVQYHELFESNEVRRLEGSYAVFVDAARPRTETGLATPDALHAATALRAGCALFITNDADFRRVQGLPIVVLDDLLAEESRA